MHNLQTTRPIYAGHESRTSTGDLREKDKNEIGKQTNEKNITAGALFIVYHILNPTSLQ